MRIFLCGDVMTGRGIDQILPFPSDPVLFEPYINDAREYVTLSEGRYGWIPRLVDFSYIWGDALNIWGIMQPAIKIVNLETSVTRSDEAWPLKGINYRMTPENTGCLTAAGINCCALANNHVLDWGYTGLSDTITALNRNRIKTAGAGLNLAQASAPCIIYSGEKGRILLVSMGMETSGIPFEWAATDDRPGVFLIDTSVSKLERILGPIRSKKQSGDIIIVSIHWGPNWVDEIPLQHRNLAHTLIDNFNVDIVHGHSSHHVLGIEIYQNRCIIYGCGDFITDYEGISGYENYRGDLELMYFVDTNNAGNFQALRMFPVQMRQFRLSIPSVEDCLWLEHSLNEKGKELGTSVRWDENSFILRWG
jgi:poly-gamma-glutamate synthesis protein (capsule biosynthesis protein)